MLRGNKHDVVVDTADIQFRNPEGLRVNSPVDRATEQLSKCCGTHVGSRQRIFLAV